MDDGRWAITGRRGSCIGVRGSSRKADCISHRVARPRVRAGHARCLSPTFPLPLHSPDAPPHPEAAPRAPRPRAPAPPGRRDRPLGPHARRPARDRRRARRARVDQGASALGRPHRARGAPVAHLREPRRHARSAPGQASHRLAARSVARARAQAASWRQAGEVDTPPRRASAPPGDGRPATRAPRSTDRRACGEAPSRDRPASAGCTAPPGSHPVDAAPAGRCRVAGSRRASPAYRRGHTPRRESRAPRRCATPPSDREEAGLRPCEHGGAGIEAPARSQAPPGRRQAPAGDAEAPRDFRKRGARCRASTQAPDRRALTPARCGPASDGPA